MQVSTGTFFFFLMLVNCKKGASGGGEKGSEIYLEKVWGRGRVS